MATGLALKGGGPVHGSWPYFEGHEPPPNTPPVAAFTQARTYKTVTFNAATSSDADGTIAGYAWDFGDGTSGAGVNPSHTYATGTYTATLTVTDNAGGTTSVSHAVTVLPLLSDTFNRADSPTSLGSTDGGTLAAQAWSVLTADTGAWKIVSNRAAVAAGTATALAVVDAGSTGGVTRATFPVVNANTGRTVLVPFRVSSLTNYFFVSSRYNSTHSWGIVKKIGGTNTNLLDLATVPAANDVVEIRDNGATIEVFINGVSKGSINDTALNTATKVGMGGNFSADTTSRWDSFEHWPI